MIFARSPRRAAIAALFVLAVSAISCDSGSKRTPTYPTEGTLLIAGKPADGARVVFYSTNPNDADQTHPFATTNPDGTFSLTTSAQNDGAPAGEYIVTVRFEQRKSPLAQAKSKSPEIDKKYGDPKTSPLRAKIENKPKNTLDPLDVR